LADLGEALTDSDKVQALKESISEEDVLNIFSDSL
jgi:hypothetical protein